MFGLRKSERAVYEAHIATLQEQVHWLRSCLPWVVPTAGTTVASTRLGATPPPLAAFEPEDGLPLHISEDEEDIREAVRNGDLDTEEAKAILRTLGLNDEIEFAD